MITDTITKTELTAILTRVKSGEKIGVKVTDAEGHYIMLPIVEVAVGSDMMLLVTEKSDVIKI